VRIAVVLGVCGALLLGACGGSNKAIVSTDPSSTTVSADGGTTSTTQVLSTTSLPCQPIPIPTTPVTSPIAADAVLLTKVQLLGDNCVDHVVFDFDAKGSTPPGYTITYGTPPFTADASGAPVPVTGNAFVVVKVQHGYGYDFAAAKQTYTGPKSVPVSSSNHVRSIVETGDFEGVLTWVIGLDAKRPFSVQATGTPNHQLVVTIS